MCRTTLALVMWALAVLGAGSVPAETSPADESAPVAEARLRDLEKKADQTKTALDAFEKRLAQLEDRLGATYQPVSPWTTIERRLTEIERRLDRVERDVQRLSSDLKRRGP